jgi:hypothetical protein
VASEMCDKSVVSRALGYPYERPSSSFLYGATGPGSWEDITATISRAGSSIALLNESSEEDLHPTLAGRETSLSSTRTAVLAIGSNAAPGQLARKYQSSGTLIPVLKAKLVGCDVVYTPLITSYGSIAATLMSSADTSGTVVDVFVTMLDDAQLRRMHETEGGYHIARLLDVSTRLRIAVDDTTRANSRWNWPASVPVYAYVSRRGVLNMDRSPVALAEISARHRELPEFDQQNVQRQVMRLLCINEISNTSNPRQDLTAFALANVKDDGLRRRRNDELLQFGAVPTIQDAWTLEGTEHIGVCHHSKHVD